MDSLDAMQQAIEFVEDNIYEKLMPEVIATQAYMSSFQFQRVFSVLCGITLGDYIRNRKLTLAGQEIADTKEKIIDISYRYGYESPESFTRAFTRFHGVSPMTMRTQKAVPRQFNKLSIHTIIGGREMMKGLQQRGYTVKENGPVYYTEDMDATAKWFEEVLGWYVNIDARDEDGKGSYGCALPIPGELVNLKIANFIGIHLFRGEPAKRTVTFMQVEGVEKLIAYVKSNGWTQVTGVTVQPWGGKECSVTTLDGSVMRFFEL